MSSLLQEESIVQYLRLVLLRYRSLFKVRSSSAHATLFRSLCSREATCKHFTSEAAPKEFGTRMHMSAALDGDVLIRSCPTSHRGDGRSKQCASWCLDREARDHCSAPLFSSQHPDGCSSANFLRSQHGAVVPHATSVQGAYHTVPRLPRASHHYDKEFANLCPNDFFSEKLHQKHSKWRIAGASRPLPIAMLSTRL